MFIYKSKQKYGQEPGQPGAKKIGSCEKLEATTWKTTSA